LPIRPSWLALFGLAVKGLVWLIGDAASANVLTQFAVVAMMPFALATVLGTLWVRALAFPLLFLFFAVPFGDALVPYLTDWTADFAVAALKLSGVPVYREGNSFSIPSGDWSVIEACSGIRYLFACLTVATLYAWTIYRTNTRRILFVTGAFVIAIVANWLRAYLTVLVAHFSGNRLGTGFDHIVFAEVLYGVVLLLVFWLGTRWREDRSDNLVADEGTAIAGSVSSPLVRQRSLSASLAAAALLSVWPLVSQSTAEASHRASGRVGDIKPRAGWVRVDAPVASWRPQLRNPSQERLQTFEKDGRRVSVYLGVFDRPAQDSKLTSAANQLVASPDPHWRQFDRGSTQVNRGSDVISVGTSTLIGRDPGLSTDLRESAGLLVEEALLELPASVVGVASVPRDPAPQDIEDRVHDQTHRPFAVTMRSLARQQSFDHFPFVTLHIGRIGRVDVMHLPSLSVRS
jgi:exosortase A